MAERTSLRRRAFVLAFALFAACGDSGGDKPGPSRVLDTLCAGDRCKMVGDLRKTTGPTADTSGYVFGPSGGELTMSVTELGPEGGYLIYRIEALVAGTGTLEPRACDATGLPPAACQPFPTLSLSSASYQWVRLSDGTVEDTSPPKRPETLIVRGTGRITFADLRVVSVPKCSIAHVGARTP